MSEALLAPVRKRVTSGIVVTLEAQDTALAALEAYSRLLEARGLAHRVEVRREGPVLSARFLPDPSAPYLGRLQAMECRNARELGPEELCFEIFARMLEGPVAFSFPNLGELEANVRMRLGIVAAARETELTFNTAAADRPAAWWVEGEDGFAIGPEADLVAALEAATQPEEQGPRYAFSCYRASEYAMLTGMAAEMKASHPALYRRLEACSRVSLIKSRRFHDTFLVEYGAEVDLPADYYVPGDRVWFRNPDEASADVSGYEGSWTIYLGGGQFANFWQRHRPYTLVDKCLELYHWRNGLTRGPDGQLAMDETRVAALVEASRANPVEMQEILTLMLRPRDPGGVYGDGGCLDRTREYPRCILPGTADMPL